MGDDELILKGGRANVGNVVRIGDQVARPVYPQTPSVEHFLSFLHAEGLDFVPKTFGYDEQQRHRLEYLHGEVATPPFPQWAFDDRLLVNVARRQRLLHEASSRYTLPDDAIWAVSAGDYFPQQAVTAHTQIVCHNDLGMSNTVVDPADQSVVGFIDFDYCRPVDPLFDIAVAARHWVPFGDLDLGDDVEIRRIHRFALFCAVHELSIEERRQVVLLAVAFLEKARENIRNLANAGQVGFQTLLANGYEATNLATVSWLTNNTEALATQR